MFQDVALEGEVIDSMLMVASNRSDDSIFAPDPWTPFDDLIFSPQVAKDILVSSAQANDISRNDISQNDISRNDDSLMPLDAIWSQPELPQDLPDLVIIFIDFLNSCV